MVSSALHLALKRPLTAAFGRYLATRIDLVPEALCAELAVIEDTAPASHPDSIRDIFIAQLGRAPEWVFAEFDPVPFASRLFWQAHHARVGHCEAVVKVVHPELAAENAGVDCLDAFAWPLAAAGLEPRNFRIVLDDFLRALPSMTALSDDVHAASLLARDARTFDGIAAPRVWPHICAPGIAVYERCRNLDDPTLSDPDLLRAVCLAWLRQALHGSVFPVEPTPAGVGVSRDSRVIFHSGPYAALEDAARAELLKYLIAVASGNVDEAAVRLQAAAGLRAGGDAAALLRNIRQMAPFRDGYRLGPGAQCGGATFTEEVLIHWRIAAQCGCAGTLTPFYCGFSTMAATARALQPGRDLMAEALRDLRLMGAFRDIQDLVRPSEAPAMLEGFAVTMMRMPEDMDRLLSAFAAGHYPEGERRESRASEPAATAILCMAIALAAAALAAHRLGSERLAAGLFLAAGLILLYMLSRRR